MDSLVGISCLLYTSLWGGNVVDIVIYGTEKTLDAYKFNLRKNKQMFINQINNGTIAVRRIDEDSMDEDNGMNFAEFVACLLYTSFKGRG